MSKIGSGSAGRFTTVLQLFFLLVFPAAIATTWSNSTNYGQKASQPLTLTVTKTHVVMDNGRVKVTLTNPSGSVAGIEYNGIDNVLEYTKKETDRGEWDIVWSSKNVHSRFDLLFATNFKIIVADQNQIEVSFVKYFNSHDQGSVPLVVDKRYVMLPRMSGFYTYAIFDHPRGWPDLDICEARIAFNLRKSLFSYMAISDDIQREMPTAEDRKNGETLAFREAALLTNPLNPSLKGEVCSNEFLSGGPIKQDLTSHVGPTSLMVFLSDHYAGSGFSVRIRNGERWKKVFGPVFIYLNSDSGNNPHTLWENAKEMAIIEKRKWPYTFLKSRDYPSGNQRCTVAGRLLVSDRFLSKGFIAAKFAYIGLALPGNPGSWQHEAKGYQFWTKTNDKGYFKILAVRAGFYNLYAWIPGILGDFKYNKKIYLKPGDNIDVSNLIFYPPRNGPTLWEIGIPDRKASEFFVPDPKPGLANRLFINNKDNKYRQYGLWDRYTDYYPKQDLVYTVGKSDYRKSWFFAHVNRVKNNAYEPTTWRVLFWVDNVNQRGTYTLRIALAASSYAVISVWINNPHTRANYIVNGLGADNSIARHGIHGMYSEHSYSFPGSLLVKGQNTIFLQQSRGGGPFIGVMYDYIRLEGPQ
nr:probable rhamnogalacturonate lyase B [Ipomoea batatas]